MMGMKTEGLPNRTRRVFEGAERLSHYAASAPVRRAGAFMRRPVDVKRIQLGVASCIMSEACHSLISGVPCIGAGWRRCDTKAEEGMAGAPAAGECDRAAGSAMVRFVRPVRLASIRTFGEPGGFVLVGVLDYFRALPSEARPAARRSRQASVQPLFAVTRTRRYKHRHYPNRHFSARPKGGDHQWGKDPPKEVVG